MCPFMGCGKVVLGLLILLKRLMERVHKTVILLLYGYKPLLYDN